MASGSRIPSATFSTDGVGARRQSGIGASDRRAGAGRFESIEDFSPVLVAELPDDQLCEMTRAGHPDVRARAVPTSFNDLGGEYAGTDRRRVARCAFQASSHPRTDQRQPVAPIAPFAPLAPIAPIAPSILHRCPPRAGCSPIWRDIAARSSSALLRRRGVDDRAGRAMGAEVRHRRPASRRDERKGPAVRRRAAAARGHRRLLPLSDAPDHRRRLPRFRVRPAQRLLRRAAAAARRLLPAAPDRRSDVARHERPERRAHDDRPRGHVHVEHRADVRHRHRADAVDRRRS